MGWTVQGSSPGRGKQFFSPSKSPAWLWNQPSFQCVWYWGSLLGGKSAGV